MLCPVLTPAELWQATGRYEIPELFKLEDRAGRPFVLPITHEETFTFHAREIQSYRELPQILYHFQTKDRDEPRPRGGLLRVREFIMKDAYSFDRDDEGLERSFRLHLGAYERIFERCGIEVHAVEAESGMMGGVELDRLPRARRRRREHPRDVRARRLRRRYRGRPRRSPRAAEFPDRLDAPQEVETPGVTTIDGARRAARPRPGGDVQGDAGREAGRDGRSRPRARGRPARRGAPRGRARGRLPAGDGGGDPHGVRCRPGLARPGRLRRRDRRRRGAARTASSSPAPTGPAGICAVSRPGGTSSRASPTSASRARATRARAAAGALRFQVAIEVGHIFKLETRYSVPLGAVYLDESGSERPIVMGSYGIGPGRILAAAVEQRHDEEGICWPRSLAPYDVHVVAIGVRRRRGSRAGRSVPARRSRRRAQRPARRPRPPSRREVRRRRPDRLPAPRHRRQEDRSRTAGSTCSRRASRERGARAGRRRRRPITHASWRHCRDTPAALQREAVRRDADRADGGAGRDLPAAGRQGRPLGRLPEPHRPRQPAGSLQRRDRRRSPRRSASSPSTSASTASA